MTIGEWWNLGFKMVWSINDEDSWREFDKIDTYTCTEEQWKEAYDNILLDFTAPEELPDGTYTVMHHGYYWAKGFGALVQNRQFIPVPTEAAILEAVCQSYGISVNDLKRGRAGIDHVYIEGFRWDGETLEVVTGS